MLIRKKPSEICICTWASVQSFSKPVLKCIFSLFGPLLYFVVPRGLFCIGGETPIHQSSGSAINMQHLECMSWMTSWQCLRMCGPSLCLSLKRRKAPSQTLCQTVQEMKKRRLGNLFFCFSLPNTLTILFPFPGHSYCEWLISNSTLLTFNVETEQDSRVVYFILFLMLVEEIRNMY